ncbi:MAG TPA: DUF423 domain-containing protein [Burkholderiaceae bacterium]|nr:DUF423 domain-containing protein [Burkholderiaceae bacterium]
MTERQLVVAGAVMLLIGVGAGAFGAHGLKRLISPEMLGVWQTAVLYQLVHGLGLLLLAVLCARFGVSLLGVAGGVMLLGILIFSGSLYALVLTDVKWLGAITPIGGMAFLVAWGMVAVAAYRAS